MKVKFTKKKNVGKKEDKLTNMPPLCFRTIDILYCTVHFLFNEFNIMSLKL